MSAASSAASASTAVRAAVLPLEFPGSAEEAAALLGSAITRCGTVAASHKKEAVLPPAGMHPAFAVTTHSAELLHRLYVLRAMLRTVATAQATTTSNLEPALPAAPSILQVLKKLLGISTQLAAEAAAATSATSAASSSEVVVKVSKSEQQQRLLLLKHKHETPPMLSTPCRILWVDCVVLCHALYATTHHSGSSDSLTVPFVRQMLGLASIHPRSAKAAGGVRIAALSVVAALFEHDNDRATTGTAATTPPPPHTLVLTAQLAPWTLDVLQVCLKALRSAGNGEPTFRMAAIRAAGATAVACRNAAWRNRRSEAVTTKADLLLLPGAMEDKAIAESIKVLKQAATDKFPEVRSLAATLAALLAPVVIPFTTISNHHHHADPLASLEDVLQFALKNLDDEVPVVADGWAEAVARCVSTALQYQAHWKKQTADSVGAGELATTSATAAAAAPGRFGSRHRSTGLVHNTLTSVPKAMDYLVDHCFGKAGGELAAVRGGGSFSVGGRAVRLGYCLTLTRLLRLQSELGAIGESRSISMLASIVGVLGMAKNEMDEQLNVTVTRTWSKSDAGLVRLFTSRVLRHGLSELAAEPSQVSILQELINMLPGEGQASMSLALNANQLQVVLIEISHLVATLGEAVASRVEETITRLQLCLSHDDAGVRHEAAVACVAIASSFPSDGRKLVMRSVDSIYKELAQLVSVVSAGFDKNDERKGGLGMFRRPLKETKSQGEITRSHEFAIHGTALLVSMLIKDLPQLPGGLPRDFLGAILTVAEVLVSSQFNDKLVSGNAGAACACVRAGFCMISGVLASGPCAVDAHMPLIIGTWQKSGKAAKEGGKNLTLEHDLVCLDAALSSIVTFLTFCSELLLSIPEALSQVTVLVEDIFSLLQPTGRLGNIPSDPLVTTLVESATASLMEAFAWLPSGSFPLVADEVFSFSAAYIRRGVEDHITCSILYHLVAKEDSILDSKPLSRASKDGQVGGVRDIEETIISLTGEVTSQRERESVLHLRSNERVKTLGETPSAFRGSSILEHFASDTKVDKPPTPLHEVGTWRRPSDPSCSSKVRIVDAAIQAFSATFGLKDGKEQQGAMDMLESLVPPPLAQFARTIGINTTSAEHDRRSKVSWALNYSMVSVDFYSRRIFCDDLQTKEDNAAVANITAVLLSCLQALPLHEATHNIPIGLGPPWMNKAKDLLLTLLPSASTIVRRAAAEGLALLATLGVTEDAHFLQSTLLHSLDEVMQGNKPDGKGRALALEPVSAARAGSLLTLACIQRTSYNVAQRKRARARGRVYGSKTDEAVDKSNENLPVLQMMTRILPSAACHGFRDYFAVKTYALHSFAVLLIYSARLNAVPFADDDMQLLRKGIELVEDNFSNSWTAASIDIDRGQEAEKIDSEVAFLAVLLRLMTFLLPLLHHLVVEDRDIARRFSVMATIILESHGFHPVIYVESMAFVELLMTHLQLIPAPAKHVLYSENPVFSCMPSVLHTLTPTRPGAFATSLWQPDSMISFGKSLRAAVYIVKLLPSPCVLDTTWSDLIVASRLVASLEAVCGSRHYIGGNLLRSVAASREVQLFFNEGTALESEIFEAMHGLLPRKGSECFLRWILFSRQLLSRFSSESVSTEMAGYTRSDVIASAISRAESDGSCVYETANPVRWQVKCLAAQIGAESLRRHTESECQGGLNIQNSAHFDLITANNVCAVECAQAAGNGGALPSSRVIFHHEDILASACLSSVAALDQAELRTLQENSMHLLHNAIECFGPIKDPDDPTGSILHQHSTQIFASVKHALAAPEESYSAASSRLFVAGCEALCGIVKTGVSSDPMVVKRLLRPTLLPADSLPLFTYSDGYPSKLLHVEDKYTHLNARASLAVRIGSIWTVGSLLIVRKTDLGLGYLEQVSNDLIKDELNVAVHSAAAAVDGCRLLYTSNLSLVGLPCDAKETRNAHECGFHYRNDEDLDESVKELLARTWSSCSIAALKPLLEACISEESDQERRKMCSSWMKVLLPVFLAGVNDGVQAILANDPVEIRVDWARGIDASLVLKDCLYGISLFVNTGPVEWFGGDLSEELERMIELLRDSVLMPTIRIEEYLEEPSNRFDLTVVSEVCSLIQSLATCKAEIFSTDTILLVCLLRPLNYLQLREVKFGDTRVEEVISTCLTSMGSLIRRGIVAESLVDAMLNLAMDSLLPREFEVPPKVRDAGKVLLWECLSHDNVTLKNQEKIACQLASSGNWEGWAVTANLNDGTAIVKSLQVVQEVLRDPGKPNIQVSALAALRSVLHDAPVPGLVAGRILHGVGADVVGVIYQYGTMKVPDVARSYRIAVCADAMKIVLEAYQQVSTSDSDEQVANFLSVIFETLLAVLRFNGLPNHASPETLGDPALGRMSAQATLHIARTTPVPFKSCLATLSDHDRTLLEFSVRAEMSGYAVTAQQQAPTKKKLNLKGFKK